VLVKGSVLLPLLLRGLASRLRLAPWLLAPLSLNSLTRLTALPLRVLQ